MLDPKNRVGYSATDQRFLEIIDEFGWHVMNVAPRADSDDEQEWFSYSTGLYRAFNHPEILLFGLDADTATPVINDIGNEVKDGRRFEQNEQYGGIFGGGVRCQFREVLASNYADYVGFAQWFYESVDFPVLQCFWPDKIGKYPWEEGCSPAVVQLQPLLYQRKK
jgi:uncharacterized protein DUF4262